MVRIIYRHDITPGTEAAFTAAWERCRTKMFSRARGALESTLFRDANDPNAFFTVTRWRSLDDWKAYWGEGVPDPEGEIASNTILLEVMSVAPHA
jgi:heme-degrading monooxygenase HmoA